MNDATTDLYECIGVSPDASQQAIEDACLRHGEILRGPAECGDVRAAEQFALIEAAFETLGNAQKRRQYDTALALRQQQHAMSTAAEDAFVARDAHYKAILGANNQNYYLDRFFQLDRQRKAAASWHWPAMFATLFWLVYRKMWLNSFLYFVLAFLVPIPIAVVLAGMFGQTAGVTIGASALVFWIGTLVLPAMYANPIYFRHCRKKIVAVTAASPDLTRQLADLARQGGTSSAAALFVVAWLFIIPIGILATVGIPALQDYQARIRIAAAEMAETSPGRAIMREADRAPGDRALQEKQLAALERELAKPRRAHRHAAEQRRSGRKEPAGLRLRPVRYRQPARLGV